MTKDTEEIKQIVVIARALGEATIQNKGDSQGESTSLDR